MDKKTRIDRIVIIISGRFNKRNYERFGVSILQKNGFVMEIWDINSVLFKHSKEKEENRDFAQNVIIKTFYDRDNLRFDLSRLAEKDFVVPIFPYYGPTSDLFKAISKSNAHYAFFNATVTPTQVKKDAAYYLKKLSNLNLFNRNKRKDFLFWKLPYQFHGIKPARLLLAGGNKSSVINNIPVSFSTEVLWGHTLDYDIYLREKNRKGNYPKPYGVLIDANFPFNLDPKRLNIKPCITAEQYYPLVNNFLDKLEKDLGIKTIIAAHPHSQYDKRPECYKGRLVIKGETARLIRDSEFVLGHSSTSVCFANLFSKPMIFLTSHDLEKSFQGSNIKIMAKWFGKEPVFMEDNTVNWEEELKISKAHYDNYRSEFIKCTHSKNIPFWQIVADRIKKGFYCDIQ